MRKLLLLLPLLLYAEVVQLEQPFFFDRDSTIIKESEKKKIDKLAPYLTKMPSLKKRSFTIIGHSDPSGTEEYNIAISKHRACNVKKYLVKKHHLDPKRFTCIGKGSTEPFADNSLDSGRALNRRVYLTLKPADELLHVDYTYDALGRVIKAAYSTGETVTIDYDEMGNILKRSLRKSN